MAKNDFKATLPSGKVIEAQSDTQLRKQIEKELGTYKTNWTWTSSDNGFTYTVLTDENRAPVWTLQSQLPEIVVTPTGVSKAKKKPEKKTKPKLEKKTTEPRKSIIDAQQGRNAQSEKHKEAYNRYSQNWGLNSLNEGRSDLFTKPIRYQYSPYYLNPDGTMKPIPIYYDDTKTYKAFREANDAVADATATIFLAPSTLTGLASLRYLPQGAKALWQGGKYLANQWRLNPLWGAYETARVAAPVVTSFGAGMLGGYGVDKASEYFTGKTWGQNMSELTGLPEPVADFTNFGYMLGGPGYKYPKAYLDGVERRGVEMAMKTSSMANPLSIIAETLEQSRYSFNPFSKVRKSIRYAPKKEIRSLTKDRLNYLFFGKRGQRGYNNLAVFPDAGEYNGLVYYGGNTPEMLDGVIDNAIYPETILNEQIGRLSSDQSFGIHAPYVADNAYGSKGIRVYDVDTDIAQMQQKSRWDRMSRNKIRSGNNVLEVDESIPLANGRNEFNAAGHRREYRINPVTGRVEFRDQDIWKFLPEDYEYKWLTGENVHLPDGTLVTREIFDELPLAEKQKLLTPFRNANWTNRVTDAGLRLVNRVTTPHIYRTPWIPWKPYVPNTSPALAAPPAEVVLEPGTFKGAKGIFDSKIDDKLREIIESTDWSKFTSPLL